MAPSLTEKTRRQGRMETWVADLYPPPRTPTQEHHAAINLGQNLVTEIGLKVPLKSLQRRPY